MSPEKIFAISIVVLIALLGVAVLLTVKPKKLKVPKYTERWRVIQATLKDKNNWVMAILDADAMLGEALKKRKFKGKTVGERLVSAQKMLSDHDSVWSAHKLRNRLAHGEQKSVKEDEVKKALIAIRQALKDLGAL